MCGNDASCSELPSGSLSPMKLGIVILEHVHAIGEGKKSADEKKPGDSVYSDSQLTSFTGHIPFVNLDVTN